MKIKRIILSVFVTLFSLSAYAGLVSDLDVVIETENLTASGNMKTARYSNNELDFIGCGTRTIGATDLDPGFQWGFCQAQNTQQESVICYAYDKPDLLAQIRALADNSYIVFSWDENGDCTFIGNSTQSFYLPMNKEESKAQKKADKDE